MEVKTIWKTKSSALSWREFVESGFDGREYQFPDFDGTFAATIACKRMDKEQKPVGIS